MSRELVKEIELGSALKLVQRKDSGETSASYIRRLPPMHALAAFEAAARLQTFA